MCQPETKYESGGCRLLRRLGRLLRLGGAWRRPRCALHRNQPTDAEAVDARQRAAGIGQNHRAIAALVGSERDTSFTPAPFLDNEYLERLLGGVKVRSLLIKLVHDAVGPVVRCCARISDT